MKIFISYSTRDEKIVRKIVSLIPSSVYTWIDHKSLTGGNILSRKIKKGISEADVFFVFISNNSVESAWVRKEIKWALEKEDKIKHDFIVPIVLSTNAWDNLYNNKIKEKKFIDVNNHENVSGVANELKDAILGIVIESRRCILSKEFFGEAAKVVALVIAFIAFFSTPPKDEHFKLLEGLLDDFTPAKTHFNDLYVLSYATYPLNKNENMLTVGMFGMLFSRKITFD